MASLHSTITANSANNYIVCGKAATDLGITLKFTARRGSLNCMGTIKVSSPFTDYVDPAPLLDFDPPAGVGITAVVAEISGADIRIKVTVDNTSATDVTFDYNLSVVRGTKYVYLPAWGYLPYFALPSTGVSVIVGQEATIYGDTLINVPIVNHLTVIYTCDIGTQSGNDFVIEPEAEDIGDHSLTILFKERGVPIITQTITLKVYEIASDLSKKILMIGDSLVYVAAPTIASGFTQSTGQTITWLGTQTRDGGYYGVVNHEGKSGFTWNNFISNASSPFVKSGVLNVPAYFTDNSITTPDYVLIRLGVNDAFGNSNGDMTDAELISLVNDSKTFVDGFLNFNTDLKVIIGLPSISENTGAGWNANYDESVYSQDKYIEIIHKIQYALVDTYANGIYNARVDVSYEVNFLDRNDGYPKVSGIHSNGIHLSTSGYLQLGKGIGLTLNKFIARDILLDGNTVNDFDGLSGVTTDGSSQVTKWKSKTGLLSELLKQVNGPLFANGEIKFTSTAIDTLKAAFVFNEPMVVYLIAKIDSWIDNSVLFDGYTFNSCKCVMKISSPTIYLFGTGYACSVSNLIIGRYAIIKVIGNDAASSIAINEYAAGTGNPGTSNMDGLVLGSHISYGNLSNYTVKRIILRSSDIGSSDIIKLLKAEYSSKDF